MFDQYCCLISTAQADKTGRQMQSPDVSSVLLFDQYCTKNWQTNAHCVTLPWTMVEQIWTESVYITHTLCNGE